MNFYSALSPFEERRARPGTYLADPRDLNIKPFSSFLQLMTEKTGMRLNCRKFWEWDFIAHSAEELGLLNNGTSCLGLGCGYEDVMYFFARMCGKVLATDIYSHDSPWDVARITELNELHTRFNRFEYNRENLEFQSADMRSVNQPSQTQDFIWSTSSIEHVDTIADSYRVASEVARLLKPGGYGILTTEFTLTPDPYLMPGLNVLNKCLLEAFYLNNPAFEVVGPVDLRAAWGHPATSPMPRREITTQKTRIVCEETRPRDFRLVVGYSIITPVGFVVRRTKEAIPSLNQIALPSPYDWYMRATDMAYHNPTRKLLEEMVEVFCSPASPLPHQVRCNFLIVIARVITQSFSDMDLLKRVCKTGLDLIPQGEIQDGDFIDTLSHLLQAAGELRLARDTLFRALASPGAFLTHIRSMIVRYLHFSAALNEFPTACEAVRPYLAYMDERGVDAADIAGELSAAMGIDKTVAIQLTEHIRGM